MKKAILILFLISLAIWTMTGKGIKAEGGKVFQTNHAVLEGIR